LDARLDAEAVFSLSTAPAAPLIGSLETIKSGVVVIDDDDTIDDLTRRFLWRFLITVDGSDGNDVAVAIGENVIDSPTLTTSLGDVGPLRGEAAALRGEVGALLLSIGQRNQTNERNEVVCKVDGRGERYTAQPKNATGHNNHND
jgi:hypothetical protein